MRSKQHRVIVFPLLMNIEILNGRKIQLYSNSNSILVLNGKSKEIVLNFDRNKPSLEMKYT